MHLTHIQTLATLQQSDQSLQTQYNELTSHFHGFPITNPSFTPSDPALAAEFAHASNRPQLSTSSSFLKNLYAAAPPPPPPHPRNPCAFPTTRGAQLFPYRNDPVNAPEDQSNLNNQ